MNGNKSIRKVCCENRSYAEVSVETKARAEEADKRKQREWEWKRNGERQSCNGDNFLFPLFYSAFHITWTIMIIKVTRHSYFSINFIFKLPFTKNVCLRLNFYCLKLRVKTRKYVDNVYNLIYDYQIMRTAKISYIIQNLSSDRHVICDYELQ